MVFSRPHVSPQLQPFLGGCWQALQQVVAGLRSLARRAQDEILASVRRSSWNFSQALVSLWPAFEAWEREQVWFLRLLAPVAEQVVEREPLLPRVDSIFDAVPRAPWLYPASHRAAARPVLKVERRKWLWLLRQELLRPRLQPAPQELLAVQELVEQRSLARKQVQGLRQPRAF